MKKIILTDLLIISLLFCALEIGLRAFDSSFVDQIYNSQLTNGHPLEVNAANFRGPLVVKEKKEGEVRVMALGDSITFGTAVAAADSWPLQLKKILTEKLHRRVSVINTALPGTSLDQINYALEHGWQDYHSDYYVLAITGNMVSLAWLRKAISPTMPQNGFEEDLKRQSAFLQDIKSIPSHFAVYNLLKSTIEKLLYFLGIANFNVDIKDPYGPILAHGWKQAGLDPAMANEAWEIVAKDLDQLNQRVLALHAKLIVISIPERFLVSSKRWDNQKFVPMERFTIVPGERLQEICQRLDISYLNTLPLLQAERESLVKKGQRRPALYIANDFSHLDSQGYKVVAEGVSEKISELVHSH